MLVRKEEFPPGLQEFVSATLTGRPPRDLRAFRRALGDIWQDIQEMQLSRSRSRSSSREPERGPAQTPSMSRLRGYGARPMSTGIRSFTLSTGAHARRVRRRVAAPSRLSMAGVQDEPLDQGHVQFLRAQRHQPAGYDPEKHKAGIVYAKTTPGDYFQIFRKRSSEQDPLSNLLCG